MPVFFTPFLCILVISSAMVLSPSINFSLSAVSLLPRRPLRYSWSSAQTSSTLLLVFCPDVLYATLGLLPRRPLRYSWSSAQTSSTLLLVFCPDVLYATLGLLPRRPLRYSWSSAQMSSMLLLVFCPDVLYATLAGNNVENAPIPHFLVFYFSVSIQCRAQ